jgi:hypothetical protein
MRVREIENEMGAKRVIFIMHTLANIYRDTNFAQ